MSEVLQHTINQPEKNHDEEQPLEVKENTRREIGRRAAGYFYDERTGVYTPKYADGVNTPGFF